MVTSIVNQFVYRPDITSAPEGFTPADLRLDFESVSLRTADGLTLSAWYIPSPNARLSLLYCHGNGGDIRDWVHAAPPFVEQGISFFVFDYRGYGRSEGFPSEKGLYLDGEAAWQWLLTQSEREGARDCQGKTLIVCGTVRYAYNKRNCRDKQKCLIPVKYLQSNKRRRFLWRKICYYF